MLTRDYDKLPFMDKEPAVFERLAYDWVRAAVDPDAEHIGAAGKGDKGCDIRARVDGKVICYQVKRRKELPLSEAKSEIRKLRDDWNPDEIVFICACDVQTDVRLKSEAFSQPIPCKFFGRTDFESRLWEHPRLIEQYFGPIDIRPKGPLWNIPQGVRFFTGRDTVIHDLRQALTEAGQAALGQSMAVAGLGGIGKTQTAIAYANAFHLNYKSAFWLTAENEMTLRSSVAEIGALLELPEIQQADGDVLVAAVLRHLASLEDGLLIYDNVEDPEQLRRYLPNPRRGHVVVTSRLQNLRTHGFPLLQLPVLALTDAVNFLHQRTGRKEVDGSAEQVAAQKLAEELGFLPLALEQAAAYIDVLGASFDDYLTTYRRDGLALLDEHGAIDHPDSVAVTWAMNIEQAERENPHAIHLFRILAFLAPDDVPEEIFEHAKALGPELAEELSSGPLALAKVLEPLRRFSLIGRDEATRSLSVHRLVQSMTRASIRDEVQREILEQAVKLLGRAFPDSGNPEKWGMGERLYASAKLAFQRFGAESPEAAFLFHVSGIYCYLRGRYVEAVPLCQRALQIVGVTLGNEHRSVAETLNILALIYSAQGRYKEAEPLYQRAIRIYEADLGSEHPSLVPKLSNLASLYSSQGLYEKAELLYLRSLHINETALGTEHPDATHVMKGLADLYRHQGRFEEAEDLYLRTLHIKESASSSEHSSIAETLNGLGNLYLAQQQFEKAEPLYLRACRIYEAVPQDEHPHFGQTLINLANSYQGQERHEEAEALYLRALRIAEATLGSKHLVIASTLNNLALLYRAQGHYELAEPFQLRSLAITEAALGLEHPSVATTLNNLAVLYAAHERYEEAEPLYLRSLRIRETTLGTEHYFVAQTLNNLANLYRTQRRYEEAESLFLRSLSIKEAVLGMEHSDVASTLNNLALSYSAQGRYEEAELHFRKSMKIWLAVLGARHAYTNGTVGAYEQLLRKQGRGTEADQLRKDFEEALAAAPDP